MPFIEHFIIFMREKKKTSSKLIKTEKSAKKRLRTITKASQQFVCNDEKTLKQKVCDLIFN